MSDNLIANRIDRISFSLIYIGFGSIISQILLIREFLVSFYGNELSIGIIFTGWLVWIGIGSAAGNKVVSTKLNISRFFFILIALTPIVTLLQIITVKFSRGFLYAETGEFLSLIKLIGFSFTVLSIGCFLWGLLFTLGAKMLSSKRKELWQGVNMAYVMDSLGCVAGGLLFSFVLASLFTNLQIVLFLLFFSWSPALWQYLKSKRIFQTIAILCLITLYYILLQPISRLEHQIDGFQWLLINDRLTFIRSVDTKYQNLSLLRLENQYTIYSDGRPTYNIPDTYETEIFLHSILVHRRNAKRVLVIGGGFNGLIKEILKYPVQKIEYVEIDPALLRFTEAILDTQNQKALRDPRVRIISGDGREYLSRKQRPFDAIIINIREPSTASMNRFFTMEFYQQCAARLTSDGILAFSFPSSAEYITDEMKKLNASIYHTFNKVFRNILFIPGNHAVLIGSMSKNPLVQNPDSLAQLFTAAKIPTEYFSEYMFEEKMDSDRINYITAAMESVKEYSINTDMDPVTYYLDLLLWNRFLQEENKMFSSLTRTNIFIAGSLAAGVLFIVILFRRRQVERAKRSMLAIIITCGGFIGMAINLLLILNFQVTFGSVYELLGAISAVFLLGSALGAFYIARISQQLIMKFALFFILVVLAGFLLLLPQIFHVLLKLHFMPFTLAITMFCGGLIGMLFSVINRLYSRHVTDLGSIYAYDVLGSSVGALTACSLLLPILGIREMTFLLTLILLPAIFASILIQRYY